MSVNLIIIIVLGLIIVFCAFVIAGKVKKVSKWKAKCVELEASKKALNSELLKVGNDLAIQRNIVSDLIQEKNKLSTQATDADQMIKTLTGQVEVLQKTNDELIKAGAGAVPNNTPIAGTAQPKKSIKKTKKK